MKLRAALLVSALASAAVINTALISPASASVDESIADISSPTVVAELTGADAPGTGTRDDDAAAATVAEQNVEVPHQRSLHTSIQRANMLIENAAVTAPSITSPTDGSFITLSFPEIQGTATPGDVITVVFDGEAAGMTSANSEGLWSFVPVASLSDGPHTVTAIASRDGEPDSEASAPVAFHIDTIAPSRPLVTSPTPGETVTIPRPTFTGTGQPDTTMLVSIDGTRIGDTPVLSDGTWAFTPASALINGSRQLSFRGQDDAGNLGLSRNVTVTVAVPIAPPAVISPADGSSTDNVRPTVSGTAEPDAVVTIYIDGDIVDTAIADANGAWNLPLVDPLSVGSHTTSAIAENASGAVSEPSELVSFTVSTPAVEVPPAIVTPPTTPEKPEAPEAVSPHTKTGAAQTSKTTASAPLASTGSDVPVGAILGGSFVALSGLALLLAKRRRREGPTQP